MAEALHQLTGHPIKCIDYGAFTHAFVLTPRNEVLDIHGLMPWNSFLQFLADQGCIPAHAASPSVIQPIDIPDPPPIFWRHLGYTKPSKSKIAAAIKVAIDDPNLAQHIKMQGIRILVLNEPEMKIATL